LGAEEIIGSKVEGPALVLREIVERFHIRGEATAQQNAGSHGGLEFGLVLELKGTHELSSPHTGQACWHCTNLMLGLRIIGEWILPSKGKCSLCEVEAYSNFVHGDINGQRENCSTRTIRIASHSGGQAQIEACHIWCMTKIQERLEKIGAIRRKE